MSASETLPVSMMIGLLKPLLRRSLHASRPSMSGSCTSRITRSICPLFAFSTPCVAVAAADNFEFVVEAELLAQLLAQFVVVIDKQDSTHIAHGIVSPRL